VSQTTCEFPDLDTTPDDTDDLLAGIGIDIDAEIETTLSADDAAKAAEAEGLERIREFIASPARTGEPFYLDFETIPDFSRMEAFGLDPLPTLPPVEGLDELLPPDQFLSQTVPEIDAYLGRHNPPGEWIAEVIETEKAGKARKGVFEKIEAHQRRISSIANAETDRIKLMSVTPMMCRICSMAFAVGRDKPRSIYCGDNTLMEKHVLDMAWKLIHRHGPLIGFGVGFFDIPVLLTRSMVLRVHPSKVLDRKRFGSSDVLDLGQELYGGGRNLGLKPTCASLGIEASLPDVDGSQVYEMFKAGRTDEIRAYNESDVDLVQRLHLDRMAGYFCV